MGRNEETGHRDEQMKFGNGDDERDRIRIKTPEDVTEAARKLLDAFNPGWHEPVEAMTEAEEKQRRIRSGWRSIGIIMCALALIISAACVQELGGWVALGLYWSMILWVFGGMAIFTNMEPHDPYSNDEP